MWIQPEAVEGKGHIVKVRGTNTLWHFTSCAVFRAGAFTISSNRLSASQLSADPWWWWRAPQWHPLLHNPIPIILRGQRARNNLCTLYEQLPFPFKTEEGSSFKLHYCSWGRGGIPERTVQGAKEVRQISCLHAAKIYTSSPNHEV